MSKIHDFHDLVNSDDGTVGSGAVSLGTSPGINGVGTLQDALFVKEAGSADPVSMGDVHQGGLGDCFVLSVMDEIARQSVIQDALNMVPSMIYQNANGTEGVHLYNYGQSGLMVAQEQQVTNTFSPIGVNAPAESWDMSGGQKEIWAQVIEKGMAQNYSGLSTPAAYNAIANGGYTYDAMQRLTGELSTVVGAPSVSETLIMANAMNNDLMCLDTAGSGPMGYGLVADHSYAFNGFTAGSNNTEINLQNPWGYDNPSPIPIAAIANGSSGIVQMDTGHFAGGAGHGVSLLG